MIMALVILYILESTRVEAPQWAQMAADGALPPRVRDLFRGEGVSFFGTPSYGVGVDEAAFHGLEGTFYA